MAEIESHAETINPDELVTSSGIIEELDVHWDQLLADYFYLYVHKSFV